eukprot:1016455-Alexandrium_andersonii.AAC.1
MAFVAATRAATGTVSTGGRATRLRPELATGAPLTWNSCDRSPRPACDWTRRVQTVAWLVSL